MFHVGQKVECVNATSSGPLQMEYADHAPEILVKGAIYTVLRVYPDEMCIAVCPEDLAHEDGWCMTRFRPLTDTSIAGIIAQKAPRDSRKWDNRRKVRTPA